ncbi:hypothetical protein DL546_008436 [Coniochaeta pulveracea]|uniref:Microbial-type PARG catalytic domain-containing protein n=1 Tax=Coniochaeta pulveracea TaxID=177199 RepID=A0A420YL59_9PEZI|nr:hypothetical protein DL546_008436 [Coniochaeta pulveracea]
MWRNVIIREVPALLKSNARARRGVEAAELIIDPPPPSSPSKNASSPSPSISLWQTDVLSAAHRLTSPKPETPHHHPKVAILNMASPLRPGGGILQGSTGQEEWICARTTLYASLREEFYRLPEVGAIYTPDVLVFRKWDEAATELPKKEWFYVDVVSAGMLRFPDLDQEEGEGEGEGRYAEEKDREMVVKKMRAVMRILRQKGVEKVVLGAWGVGAYGNPVGEVATAWKRVLVGKKGKGREAWEGLEIVFAMKDGRTAERFAEEFGEGLVVEEFEGEGEEEEEDSEADEEEEKVLPRYGPGF